MSDYKARRDAAADKHYDETFPPNEWFDDKFSVDISFCEGADWARADLMKEVEEIAGLLQVIRPLFGGFFDRRKLEYVRQLDGSVKQEFIATPFAEIMDRMDEALAKWEQIKEEG